MAKALFTYRIKNWYTCRYHTIFNGDTVQFLQIDWKIKFLNKKSNGKIVWLHLWGSEWICNQFFNFKLN